MLSLRIMIVARGKGYGEGYAGGKGNAIELNAATILLDALFILKKLVLL